MQDRRTFYVDETFEGIDPTGTTLTVMSISYEGNVVVRIEQDQDPDLPKLRLVRIPYERLHCMIETGFLRRKP